MKAKDYYLQMADRVFIIERNFNDYILEVEEDIIEFSSIEIKDKIQQIDKNLGELYQMFGKQL